MTITPEDLAAYADGQLDPARAAEVAAAVERDPELARQVQAHKALKGLLAAHYDPIAAQPVPDRLTALLGGSAAQAPEPAQVIDFAAARERREERKRIPRWTWAVGPAMAAALGLVLLRPAGTAGPDYAPAQLAAALDSRLSADPATGEAPRMMLSFARADGELCRAYASADQSGIACRDAKGWRIERKGAGIAQSGDYRQAGSAAEELMEAAQAMAAGAALDPAQEQAARAKGWH